MHCLHRDLVVENRNGFITSVCRQCGSDVIDLLIQPAWIATAKKKKRRIDPLTSINL
jgi:hypothetical protein